MNAHTQSTGFWVTEWGSAFQHPQATSEIRDALMLNFSTLDGSEGSGILRGECINGKSADCTNEKQCRWLEWHVHSHSEEFQKTQLTAYHLLHMILWRPHCK